MKRYEIENTSIALPDSWTVEVLDSTVLLSACSIGFGPEGISQMQLSACEPIGKGRLPYQISLTPNVHGFYSKLFGGFKPSEVASVALTWTGGNPAILEMGGKEAIVLRFGSSGGHAVVLFGQDDRLAQLEVFGYRGGSLTGDPLIKDILSSFAFSKPIYRLEG